MDSVTQLQYIEPGASVSRIKYQSYAIIIFLAMGLSIVFAAARTYMRISKFHRINYDDILLLISTLFLIGSIICQFEVRDLAYFQIGLSLGLLDPPPSNLADLMVRFEQLDNVGSVLAWGSIFSVKFAFVVFFKKLVDRITNLERWWWVVFASLVITMPINMFMGFIICTDFTPTLFETCTVQGMTQREGIYLYIVTILDIVTDLLICSIPIALLWRVKISLKHKIGLGTVCSLSSVMIVISILRLADSRIQSPIPEVPAATDSAWLFVLQVVEAGVAIIMVSITAFRSMLGQRSNATDYNKHRGYLVDAEQSLPGSEISGDRKHQSILMQQTVPRNNVKKSIPIPVNAERAKGPGRASFASSAHSKKYSEAESDWSTTISPIQERPYTPLVSKFSPR